MTPTGSTLLRPTPSCSSAVGLRPRESPCCSPSVAAREVTASRHTGLPELALGGLDPQAAAALIGRRANVALSPEARQRLVAATGGNPLALLVLPEVLSEAELAGAEPMPAPLPVGERIERAFSRVCISCPRTPRRCCLLPLPKTVARSLPSSARQRNWEPPEALDAAEQERLVRVRGDQLEFHHPLVRSAIYHSVPLAAPHRPPGAGERAQRRVESRSPGVASRRRNLRT